MKKINFVTLILSTIGGLFFGIGMCMCLIPEWEMFTPGVVLACAGALFIIAMVIVRRKMSDKPPVKINLRTLGKIVYGVAAVLVLGVGMCMAMVWEGLMIPGIIVGVFGIVLLIFLVPLCRGIK